MGNTEYFLKLSIFSILCGCFAYLLVLAHEILNIVEEILLVLK